MDTAHKETDKIISTINKKLKSNYLNAYRELREEFSNLYSKIELDGEMDAQQKLNEANKYGRIQKITEFVVDKLLQTNKESIKEINQDLNGVYQLNYNAFVDSFKKDGIIIDKITKTETKEEIKENENPYNEIAINTATDKANLKRSVSNSLLSSILKVASIGSALSGIKAVFEKNLESSARISETQATMIENMARYTALEDVEKVAEKQDMICIKIWRTQGDDKVRDAHARAEGQEAELDRPFYVGGEPLMYPGDFNGSVGNIINCRCYIEYRFVKK